MKHFLILTFLLLSKLAAQVGPNACPATQTPDGKGKMRFHTWYQINCETEDTWGTDFTAMKSLGFDCVALWNIIPSGTVQWDFTEIARNVPTTKRAIQAAHNAGLRVFLGIWNPSNMGPVAEAHQVRSSKGENLMRPNIYSEAWQQAFWIPYLNGLKQNFGECPGFAGIVFDDAVACSDDAGIAFSYTAEDEQRFAKFLEATYHSINNFNLQYRRYDNAYGSFSEIKPPKPPWQSAKLWKDWMLARGEWSKGFAEATRLALGREMEIIYIDYDYYVDRSSIAYGHNITRMMESFERYGVYIAQEFSLMSQSDLLTNVRRVIAEQKGVVPTGKLHFCTWLNGLKHYEPMPPDLVRTLLLTIVHEGITDITLYPYKVHDSHVRGADRGGMTNRAPRTKLSFKYNPEMREAIKVAIAACHASSE